MTPRGILLSLPTTNRHKSNVYTFKTVLSRSLWLEIWYLSMLVPYSELYVTMVTQNLITRIRTHNPDQLFSYNIIYVAETKFEHPTQWYNIKQNSRHNRYSNYQNYIKPEQNDNNVGNWSFLMRNAQPQPRFFSYTEKREIKHNTRRGRIHRRLTWKTPN